MKIMRRMGVVLALLALSIVMMAQEEAADLPLLEPGFHLGTTFFGSGDVPQDDALAAQVESAVAQGMTAFTFYADWAALEPEPGIYDLADLEASLNWLRDLGIQPLLNISFIDIADLTLPDDLLNDDGTALADDLPFDDPAVVARLTGLLDEVVPLLVEYDGFLLLLGNEVDGYFNDFGVEPDGYARLIAAAREHVRTLNPDLAVGVTLTGTEVYQEGAVFQTLRPVTDVIPFNYYGIEDQWGDEWFHVLDADTIRADIEHYMEIYDGDPVVIQELGCPSSEANASSPEIQADCFDVMLETLREYPNVRYVTVFTFADFDEPTCDIFIDALGLTEDELPQPWFDRWVGYICELGVVNPDYSPKPAWDVFIDAMG